MKLLLRVLILLSTASLTSCSALDVAKTAMGVGGSGPSLEVDTTVGDKEERPIGSVACLLHSPNHFKHNRHAAGIVVCGRIKGPVGAEGRAVVLGQHDDRLVVDPAIAAVRQARHVTDDMTDRDLGVDGALYLQRHSCLGCQFEYLIPLQFL